MQAVRIFLSFLFSFLYAGEVKLSFSLSKHKNAQPRLRRHVLPFSSSSPYMGGSPRHGCPLTA